MVMKADKEALDKLNRAHEDHLYHDARAKGARALYLETLATIMYELGQPIERTRLCPDCGIVKPASDTSPCVCVMEKIDGQ